MEEFLVVRDGSMTISSGLEDGPLVEDGRSDSKVKDDIVTVMEMKRG
jgi:hypothetical protein